MTPSSRNGENTATIDMELINQPAKVDWSEWQVEPPMKMEKAPDFDKLESHPKTTLRTRIARMVFVTMLFTLGFSLGYQASKSLGDLGIRNRAAVKKAKLQGLKKAAASKLAQAKNIRSKR